MRAPVSHRFLPHGHYTEAPGRSRDEAVRNALAPVLSSRPGREFRPSRVRRLGPQWWSVRYLCPNCPGWKTQENA